MTVKCHYATGCRWRSFGGCKDECTWDTAPQSAEMGDRKVRCAEDFPFIKRRVEEIQAERDEALTKEG